MRFSLLGRVRRAVFTSYLEQHPAHIAFFVLTAAILALGALFGLATASGFGNVAHELEHMRWGWLPVAFSATCISYLGYMLAYREAAYAAHVPQPPLRHIGALVACGFGLFVPRGGFALDVDALKLAGVPAREARVRALTLGTLEYAVLAPVAFGLAVLLLAHDWSAQLGVRLSWAIGVPLGALLALLLVSRRAELARRHGWRARLAHGLDAIAQTVALLRQPGRGLVAFAGMSIYWAADFFVLWTCLLVFSPYGEPSVSEIVLGYATGYALTRRALPLAGAGAVEAMLPIALNWTGVALAVAVISVFAYRVFNLWLPLLPAGVAVLVLRRTASASTLSVERSP